jgi:flagellar hook assembly protein FlgD
VIYDLSGREVKTLLNKEINAGYHDIKWDGLDNNGKVVATGLYFARFESGTFQKSQKMILLK